MALFFFEIFVIVLFALMLGSFAGAVSYRAGRGESWMGMDEKAARSRCPSCGTFLGLKDLVPVFSWLGLRGKCRHCGERVSPRYVFIEMACVVLCLSAYALFGFSAQTALVMTGMPFFLSLMVVLLEQRKLSRHLLLLTLGVWGVAFGWGVYNM